LIQLRLLTAASSIFCAAFITAAAHADTRQLPLVQDIPPSTGYGDRPHDVVGLRFGDSIKDATAKLRSAFPGLRFHERLAQVGTRDGRGNSVTYRYLKQVSASASTGEPRQHFTLRFTSGVTGARLYRIERSVTYHSERPASLSEVKASIQSKYGKPTAVELYGTYQDIIYTWEKRPIVYLPETDMRVSGASSFKNVEANPCLKAAISSGYAPYDRNGYKFVPPGKRVEDEMLAPCIGGIAFRLHYGRADNTVSSIRTIASDYARTVTDVDLLDKALTAAIGDKVKSIVGTGAPKL